MFHKETCEILSQLILVFPYHFYCKTIPLVWGWEGLAPLLLPLLVMLICQLSLWAELACSFLFLPVEATPKVVSSRPEDNMLSHFRGS